MIPLLVLFGSFAMLTLFFKLRRQTMFNPLHFALGCLLARCCS